MFDESNENKTVIENQNSAENQTEPVNPYLADEPKQSAVVSPIPEEPEKKSSNKVIIGVIAGAAILFLVMVLVLVFGGLFKDDKQTIVKALQDTFTESGNYISEAWGLEQYEGMFEEGIYTVDAQLDLPDGINMDVVVQKNEEACSIYVDGGIAGSSMTGIQMYVDEAEAVIALPGILEDIFTVNRATLEDDIQNMVDLEMLSQEDADELIALNEGTEGEAVDKEAYEKLQAEVIQSCVTFWDECEVKKGSSKQLTVNDKEVSSKGYVVTVTGENLAKLAENLKENYQENEAVLKAVMDASAGMAVGSYELDTIYDDLDTMIEDCRELEEDVTVEFYLYDGKVAQIYLNSVESNYMEWNIEGGNFPLENTSIVVGDEDGVIYELKRTGTDSGKYRARYEMGDGNETFAIDLKYSGKNGNFSVEFTEDMHGYEESLLYMKGSLQKTDQSTITISIDSLDIEEETILSGDIVMENICDTIERPQGRERELLLLTEDEWYEILYEVAMSLG